jgi:hypothetical protein
VSATSGTRFSFDDTNFFPPVACPTFLYFSGITALPIRDLKSVPEATFLGVATLNAQVAALPPGADVLYAIQQNEPLTGVGATVASYSIGPDGLPAGSVSLPLQGDPASAIAFIRAADASASQVFLATWRAQATEDPSLQSRWTPRADLIT